MCRIRCRRRCVVFSFTCRYAAIACMLSQRHRGRM
jgi:hypothetical protein